MIKSLILSVALVAGASTVASADMMYHRHHAYMHHMHRVLANGRCDGMSYGTGARRCGSATGGPSGGLSNKN
jgi:hypothetical protein